MTIIILIHNNYFVVGITVEAFLSVCQQIATKMQAIKEIKCLNYVDFRSYVKLQQLNYGRISCVKIPNTS